VHLENDLSLDAQFNVEDEVVERQIDGALDGVFERYERRINLAGRHERDRIGDRCRRDVLEIDEVGLAKESLLGERAAWSEIRDSAERPGRLIHAGRIVSLMDAQELNKLVGDLKSGAITSDEAYEQLASWPFADLGFAKVDHHRSSRQGMPEAIYAPGKSPAQCAAIATELLANGSGPVLLTRASEQQVEAALTACPGGTVYPDEETRSEHRVIYWRASERRGERVVIVTAGTADLPVAGECAATLRAFGFTPVVLPDCGVAGIHRLLANYDELAVAQVVIVVAGMEGALASVVGGLVAAPVVAIPTSVGYGAALEGVTALLAMHASCAPGVTVVGIDNGYGAACAVARILR
jgi:pyridinium-3,5-biscarboxylic acid mononucleotide synthase